MLKPILFAAASLAAAVTSSPVFAKPANVEIRTVRYADLDLSSAAGQRRLEQRIQAAVRDVCGEAASFDLARRQSVRAEPQQLHKAALSPAAGRRSSSGRRPFLCRSRFAFRRTDR